MSECAHCGRIAKKCRTCSVCAYGPYCSVRCQTTDFEVGTHRRACFDAGPSTTTTMETWSGEDPDTSSLPVFFARALETQRRKLAYQAPPHLKSFGLNSNPHVAAVHVPQSLNEPRTFAWLQAIRMPDANSPVKACLHTADSYGSDEMLLIVPRLVDAVYVLLGEEHYAVDGEGSFVGAATWSHPKARAETVAFSAALGSVLGHLHFSHGIDGFGFSVVGGRRFNETQTRLFLQVDPRQVRAVTPNLYDIDGDAEIIDRLAFILGRISYVPRPTQSDLFGAFAAGYRDAAGAGHAYANAIMERMNVYLE